MADDIGITLNMKDIAELAKKLDLVDTYKDGIKASGIYLKGIISEYPPASSANAAKPYPGRWYQRGSGTKYYTKAGLLRGKKTSKTLGKRWSIRSLNGGMGVEVGNNASYAKYVQGFRDQASFHKVRGWKTDADVAEKEGDEVLNIMSDFIQAHLDGRQKPPTI